jgi:hypothetical protein
MRNSRLLALLLCGALAACAQQPKVAWLRVDGQRATGNPVLAQQFEMDRTMCMGQMQRANLSGVAVYQGGIYGAIARQERDQAVGDVATGCMAEKGYVKVPEEQAEAKHAELAAIAEMKKSQDGAQIRAATATAARKR